MNAKSAVTIAFVSVLFDATVLSLVAAGPASHRSHDNWRDSERSVSIQVQGERSAGPGAVLDQFQENSNGGGYFWAERYLAQTFTPAISGQLDHVDVLIDAWDADPSYPATISIVETTGGVPDGPVLGSVDVPGFTMGWNTVDFLPAAVFLTAETRYGIVLLNDDADPETAPTDGLGIEWDTNPYPRGEVWEWRLASGWEWNDWAGPPGSSDAAFRTWMASGTVAPPNDLCPDAICVVDGVPVSGSNENATGNVIAGCDFADPLDVWYSYTPAVSGNVTISLCGGGGATFDTTLAVLDACDGALLACNDDVCGLSSEVTVALDSDNTYLIRVSGLGGSSGDFTLSVTGGGGTCDCDPPPAPANPDPPDGAVDVPVDTDLAWNGGGLLREGIPADVGTALQSIVARSGILDGPILVSSGVVNEDGAVGKATITYTKPEDVAQVRSAVDLGIQAGAPLDVAICAANFTDRLLDIQTKLLGTGQFNTVAVIDTSAVTPTLAELHAFDAVTVHHNTAHADATALGNVMADYVDAGGGVVCTIYEIGAVVNPSLGGRWATGDYVLMDRVGTVGSQAYLGTVHDPSHPIMAGVSTFDGGSSGQQPAATTVYPGVTLVAEWSNGHPLVSVREVSGIPRADVTFYPPSSDAVPNEWDSSTDGALMLANAMTFVSGDEPCPTTHDVYFGTTDPPTDLICADVDVPMCDPGLLECDTTYYWRVIAKNPAGETPGPVWSFTTGCDQCVPPPPPANPDPADAAVDVPIDTGLAWDVVAPVPCDLPNGGFEDGVFAPWTAVTGPGDELTPWIVTTGGMGWFENGFPDEGAHFAQNGFDGAAGLSYDLYQEVAIPGGASAAILDWSERIQWDMTSDGATIPREYVVSVQPAGGGAALVTLFSMTLDPYTSGDTGYVSHSVDLLAAAPEIAGSTVRINFHETIPEAFTGPAQFDLDAIQLTCGAAMSRTGELFVAGVFDAAQQRAVSTPDAELLRAEYSHLREQALSREVPTDTKFAWSAGRAPVGPVAAARSDRERGRIALVEASEPGQVQRGLPTVGRYPISAFEGRRAVTVEILMFVGYADMDSGGEVENTLNAIAEHFVDFNVTQTTTEDPATLAGELVGKDVLLMPEQENWNPADMNAFGTSLAGTLDSFVAGGGMVIVLDYMGICDQCGGAFLNGTGLMSVGTSRAVNPEMARVNGGHPITDGVSATFVAMDGANAYESISGVTVPVVHDTTGDPMVAISETAGGPAVLIGFDYYSYNTDMARIIANAVQLGSLPPCRTTYDVYFGTESAAMDLICADVDVPTCDPGLLESERTYYWQVIAKNPAGETPGPVWSFATVGDGHCDPPPAPANPDPIDEAVDVSVDADLSWNGGHTVPLHGELVQPPDDDVDLPLGVVSTGSAKNLNAEPDDADQPGPPADSPLPAPADHVGPDTATFTAPSCEALGSFTTTFTFSGATRGNFIEVDQPETLTEILMELSFTGSADVAFVVYESTTLDTGFWNSVHQNVVATSGAGQDFYSSGPISVSLTPGTYYYVGAAWSPSMTFGLDSAATPRPYSRGTIVGGGGENAVSVPMPDPQNLHVEDDVYSMELCFASLVCPTTYDLYFGTDPGALDVICADVDAPTCDPGMLECETTYYWQVIAKNPAGETPGLVWSFTTTGCDPCDPPPAPVDPDPADGAVGVAVDTDLEWNVIAGLSSGKTDPSPGSIAVKRRMGDISQLSRLLESHKYLNEGHPVDAHGNLVGVEERLAPPGGRSRDPLAVLFFFPHRSTDTRVAGLGYSVATTDAATDLTRSNLKNYDVLWVDVGVHPLIYEGYATEIRDWVSLDGGGLTVVQPSITGANVSVFPPGYEVTIYDTWWPGDTHVTIVDPLHPMVVGLLSGADVGGNADWVRGQDIGGAWDIVAVDAETPSDVALLGAEYGSGRMVFSTGNYGSASGDPGSDQFLIQMIDWVGGNEELCAAKYDVYFGTDPGALDLICADVDVPTCDPGLLESDTTYYWQVIAKNPAGETPGPVWSFTTPDPDDDFTYQCVIVGAPSMQDQTLELPVGLTAVGLGETFFVEFWATDSGHTNTGIVSAYADLNYPEGLVTCEPPILHSDLFSLFPGGVCDGSVVDELGGSQLDPNIGVEPEWARVAGVQFTAGTSGTADFCLEVAVAESSANNRGLIPPSDIEYGCCSVEIHGCRCVYDLDNNCTVAGGDLGLFAGCWLVCEGDPEWDANNCGDKDFDCNGCVAGGDLGWFAGAWLKNCDELDPIADYPACRECDGPIVCPWSDGGGWAAGATAMASVQRPDGDEGTVKLALRLTTQLAVRSEIDRLAQPRLRAIDPGDRLYAEVWVKEGSPTSEGLTAVFADLQYDPSQFDVATIDSGDIFTLFAEPSVSGCVVSRVGGGTMDAGVGTGAWALVAVAELEALTRVTRPRVTLRPAAQEAISRRGRGLVRDDRIEIVTADGMIGDSPKTKRVPRGQR